MRPLIFGLFTVACVACGPATRSDGCVGDACNSGTCNPSETRDCYTGHMDTEGVGPCVGGTQLCLASGVWGNCVGEVVPSGEICGDGIDNNCNGMIDEDVDADGDGYTTCQGDCCDSTNECSDPALVNPGAFDVPGNGVDDDCDGIVDNSMPLCDQGLASNSAAATDYAKAIDICQMSDGTKWGLVDAKLSYPDGTGTADPNSHSIRAKFGSGTPAQGGVNMMVISSGVAAAVGDVNPTHQDWVSYSSSNESAFPADFTAAHGGSLPNAPGCPAPLGDTANDPVMLTLHVKVPTNAHSFSLKSNFYSAEFPEWTCSEYNDFFVILLDSTFSGNPGNPTDKNLAFYTDPNTMMNYPVGVNLAHGNTGLFTQCTNGSTGCSGTPGTITTCVGTTNLTGTGFDTPDPGECDDNSLEGGGTGWLTTTGNVVPGETITLRIAIWDTSDHAFDSLALVDAFAWSVMGAQPGTVIEREANDPTVPKNISSQTGLARPF
jgi:hypothetical protein